MEEKKKGNYDVFFRVLFVLFVLFLCVYAISVSGFVEVQHKEKTLYTEEQILKFESDVIAGKEVDITDYLITEEIDYSNSFSEFGELVSTLINKGSELTFEYFKKIFEFCLK